MRILLGLVVAALAILLASPAHALTKTQSRAIKTALDSAQTPELPRVAEQLVRDAAKHDRAETAMFILEYVVIKRVAAARALTATLAKAFPELVHVLSRREVVRDDPDPRPISPRPPTDTDVLYVRVIRGASASIPSAPVTQSSTPINTTSGGRGDGTFRDMIAIPAGAPICICYDQPRS